MTRTRDQLVQAFRRSIRSVDARVAVRRAIALDDEGVRLTDGSASFGRIKRIYSISLGKAALPMAAGLEDTLGRRLNGGVASGYELPNFCLSDRWTVFHGGHPVPNEESLMAARRSIDLVRSVDDETTLIIYLISGGGSAMFEFPSDESIPLSDLRQTNRVLVECGAQIGEINAIRRAVSSVKGGNLSACSPRSKKVSLIVSDTNDGEAFNVASGPTIAPRGDALENVHGILERYSLVDKLPVSISNYLLLGGSDRRDNPAIESQYRVLLQNADAVAAAKRSLEADGFLVEIAVSIVDDDVSSGCTALAGKLLELRRTHPGDRPIAIVSGGEFRCPVRGGGIGGRSLESALRTAVYFDAVRAAGEFADTEFSALFAGTDGIDGNSPAAGAVCDSKTLKRASAIGLDALDYLKSSDSYTFFHWLGDAIETGPTGTNVRDLRVLAARKTAL